MPTEEINTGLVKVRGTAPGCSEFEFSMSFSNFARLLNLNPVALHRMIALGEIPHSTSGGGRIRFEGDAFDWWLQSCIVSRSVLEKETSGADQDGDW